MASASGVLRGQLRPGIGRSPPFLVIALLIVISILAFNYWSLSDRYNTLEEQMTDIQDHLRLMTIKKENAEKQLDSFDSKLKDSEDVIRKQKTLVEEKENEKKDLVWQLDSQKSSASKLQEKLTDLNSLVEKQSVSLKDLRDAEKQLETLRRKNSELSVRNEQFDIQMRDLQKELSAAKRQFYIPPIQLPSGSKTADDVAGQLKLISKNAVQVDDISMHGFTYHEPGPLGLLFKKNS